MKQAFNAIVSDKTTCSCNSLQIDNAKDMADVGGYALIRRDLNASSEDVRAAVCRVFGAAAQR